MSDLILPGPVAKPDGSEGLDENGVMRLLAYAFSEAPEKLSIFPLESTLMGASRQNDKLPARLLLATLDSVVKNINGNPKLRDFYFVLRIPREVGDRAFSPIVTV